MLKRFRHHAPTKPQHAPDDYTFPAHGQKQQHVTPKPALKPFNPRETKRLQQIIGVYRWYCDVTDPLPLVAISKLASKQTTTAIEEKKSSRRCMEYLATFTNGKIKY